MYLSVSLSVSPYLPPSLLPSVCPSCQGTNYGSGRQFWGQGSNFGYKLFFAGLYFRFYNIDMSCLRDKLERQRANALYLLNIRPGFATQLVWAGNFCAGCCDLFLE